MVISISLSFFLSDCQIFFFLQPQLLVPFFYAQAHEGVSFFPFSLVWSNEFLSSVLSLLNPNLFYPWLFGNEGVSCNADVTMTFHSSLNQNVRWSRRTLCLWRFELSDLNDHQSPVGSSCLNLNKTKS
jgi:hypothetical protein